MQQQTQRAWPLRNAAGLAALLLPLTGCVPQQRAGKVAEQFNDASQTLSAASETLFLHANTVEAGSYIDTQAFERQPLSRTSIDAQALLSDDGLRFRHQAIVALSAYTVALATVAGAQSEQQITTSTAAAATSLSTLTSDLQAAIAKDNPAAKTADFSGAVSAAVTAAGNLIQLVERRHNRAELQASLRKNDPAMQALFQLIADDAQRLYKRQQLAVQNRGDILFASYAAAAHGTPSDGPTLLQLGDRLKQYRHDLGLLTLSDPAPAFLAWKQAHDDLVATLLENGGSPAQQARFRQTVAAVQEFVAEVQPLATHLQALAQTL